MFINEAFAASAEVSGGSVGTVLIQIALILLIFYFLLIKPQQKRMKQHQDMIQALKVGDRVITNGGIYGRVAKIDGAEIALEVAPKVEITVDRMSVSGVVQNEESAHKVSTTKAKTKK